MDSTGVLKSDLSRQGGIGMTSSVVLEYFLRAGASFRRSDAWRQQHELAPGESRILRSGRFGVGALAAFLLGDEIEVSVYGAPDLSGHTRVNENGSISIPLIGYVRVAGLSTSEAEGAIEAQLRQNNIVNEPQVSIYAKDFTNSGISVAGEVAKPGFY